MNNADDKKTDGLADQYNGDSPSDTSSVEHTTDRDTTIGAPIDEPVSNSVEISGGDTEPIDGKKGGASRSDFVGEVISLSVKAVAVALSLVMLILSILTVAMPLSAMRVFNKLGMSERALNSGNRYIEYRLNKYDADTTDEIGNFAVLSATPELSDDGFIEALDVCTNLSYKLMEDSNAQGDASSTAYFAEKLEKYTRLYMSLNGVRAVSDKKNSANIAAMPILSMRPFVYDYENSIMRMNFRARVYLNETNFALYDSGRDGDCVQTIENRSNTYANIVNKEPVLDGFVDYMSQIGEYLSIEFERMGVDGVVTEAAARNYRDKIDGARFELFIDPLNGFTYIYNNLKNFGEFAQAAVDYVPTTLDDRLHQLHWLNVLSSVSSKLWYMSMLMYYNDGQYGAASAAVRYEYTERTCEMFHFVNIVEEDGKLFADNINDKYNTLLTEYINLYRA